MNGVKFPVAAIRVKSDLMTIIPLLIFAFIELLLVIGAVFVLYHFYSFRAGRSHSALITLFIIGSVFLFLVEFTVFISIDWEAILMFAQKLYF